MGRKRQRDSSQGRIMLNSSEQQEQLKGGAAMPQPPRNWPRNGKQATQPDSSASEDQSKQTRGPTMMHSGWGKDGGILHVNLNDRGQAIGAEATKLSSHLGVIARNGVLAPLNYTDWRLVPDLYKDRIWDHIKENTNLIDENKRIVMMSVGSKWKEWKHEAKKCDYDPYDNDTERLANRPSRVEEDQWPSLVHYWSSNDAKEKSDRNKESRKKLTLPQTSGRKSYPQIIDDMTKENSVKPSRVELFKKVHTKKNKQPVNEIAGEVMKDMDEIAKVYPELNVPGSAQNDVYAMVMGPDTHGSVRTQGKGVAPSFVYGPVYKRSHVEQRDFDARVEIEVQKANSAMRIDMEKLSEAKEEREAIEKKQSEAKEEMEAMEMKMSKAKEEIEAMKKNMAEAEAEMEAKMDDKIKAGVKACLENFGFERGLNSKTINDEEVSDNSDDDRQQWSSPFSVVRTNKVTINKKLIGNSGVKTTKKKWIGLDNFEGSETSCWQ